MATVPRLLALGLHNGSREVFDLLTGIFPHSDQLCPPYRARFYEGSEGCDGFAVRAAAVGCRRELPSAAGAPAPEMLGTGRTWWRGRGAGGHGAVSLGENPCSAEPRMLLLHRRVSGPLGAAGSGEQLSYGKVRTCSIFNPC